MTVISSYEAQFKAEGVQEVKNGFAEIAKAAKQADQQQKEWSKQQTLQAKSYIAVEKQKTQALKQAANEQAKAQKQAANEQAKAQKDAAAASNASNASLKMMAGVAVATFTAVAAGVKVAYAAYQEYAGAVRDVALASGSSAQEASKLLQVLDDFEISAQDVMAATKAMTNNGLEPSMESLMKLADQYNAIQDPMEKNEFLLKNLGKSGLEYANALSQGRDALEASVDGINKSLILTDEQIKKAEQARLAVDVWSDAWQGFKVSIGSVIGSIIVANDNMAKSAENVKDLAKEYTELTGAQARVGKGIPTEAFKAFIREMERAKAMTEFYTTGQYAASAASEELRTTLEDLSSHNADLIKDAISIQASQDKYNETQEETLAKIAELQVEKAGMYRWERDDIAAVDEKIKDLQNSYAESAEEFIKAQQTKLTMMALEQIALSDGVAGYSEAEAEKAMAILATADIAEAAAIRESIAFQQVAESIAGSTDPAAELADLLSEMAKGYTVDVAVNIIQNGNMAAAVTASGSANYVQQLGTNGGGSNTALRDDDNKPKPKASGGMLSSGWNLVGDTQSGQFVPGLSELIHNGHVYSSAESEKLINSGKVKVAKSYAFGDDEHIANLSGSPISRVSNRAGGLGSRLGGNGGGDGDGESASMVASEIAAQVSAQTNIAMQTYTSNMTSAFASMNDKLDEVVAAVRDTPRANGRFVGDAIIRAQV